MYTHTHTHTRSGRVNPSSPLTRQAAARHIHLAARQCAAAAEGCDLLEGSRGVNI